MKDKEIAYNELSPEEKQRYNVQHQMEPQDEDYFEWRDCSEREYNRINKWNEEDYRHEHIRTRKVYRLIPEAPDNHIATDFIYPPRHSDKDWREDFSHENGNYINQCHYCRADFYGHKRRVVCKECASKPISEVTIYELGQGAN